MVHETHLPWAPLESPPEVLLSRTNESLAALGFETGVEADISIRRAIARAIEVIESNAHPENHPLRFPDDIVRASERINALANGTPQEILPVYDIEPEGRDRTTEDRTSSATTWLTTHTAHSTAQQNLSTSAWATDSATILSDEISSSRITPNTIRAVNPHVITNADVDVIPLPQPNDVIIITVNTDHVNLSEADEIGRTMQAQFPDNKVLILPDWAALRTYHPSVLKAYRATISEMIKELEAKK